MNISFAFFFSLTLIIYLNKSSHSSLVLIAHLLLGEFGPPNIFFNFISLTLIIYLNKSSHSSLVLIAHQLLGEFGPPIFFLILVLRY